MNAKNGMNIINRLGIVVLCVGLTQCDCSGEEPAPRTIVDADGEPPTEEDLCAKSAAFAQTTVARGQGAEPFGMVNDLSFAIVRGVDHRHGRRYPIAGAERESARTG